MRYFAEPALPAARFRRFRCRDLLDQFDKRHAARAVLDRSERLRETKRAGVGYKRQQRPRGFGAIGSLEQCGNRNAEDGGELDEASRGDAVAAGLVFLHLLECDAEPGSKLRLR